MSKPVQLADLFHLPMSKEGAMLALHITELMHASGSGRVVEDSVVEIAGVRIRQIAVIGKRPGEGQIAKHIKERK